MTVRRFIATASLVATLLAGVGPHYLHLRCAVRVRLPAQWSALRARDTSRRFNHRRYRASVRRTFGLVSPQLLPWISP